MRKRFESREYQRVPNMRFHKSNRIYSVIFLIITVYVIQYGGYKYHKWKETDSKAPDVASSISVNNYHYLTVIANRKKIDDKEVFAREIIHMCLQNSFHSVKFSTRINGYPSGLDIAVYLRYNDMEKKEPVCKIEFIAEEYGENYDIKNDSDKFHLYLDGEEIVFY